MPRVYTRKQWTEREHKLLILALASGIPFANDTEISRFMNHIKTPEQIHSHKNGWLSLAERARSRIRWPDDHGARYIWRGFLNANETLEGEDVIPPDPPQTINPLFILTEFDDYHNLAS
jgi:hypothetical protein